MQRIAVYGKGGIGKSVLATNLSVSFAMRGMSVLHVGCDPKADSSSRLVDEMDSLPTVLEMLGSGGDSASADTIVTIGRHGIHCAESGGPPPGMGCGGRGVARTLEFISDIELLELGDYDAAVFDVLGDVVCGGFAAPLRQGFGDKVVIVCSEEPMAVYAANNISKAIETYERNGVVLAGLVGNLKDSSDENKEALERFAERLSTQLLAYVPRDPQVIAGERIGRTVVEFDEEAPAAKIIQELSRKVLEIEKGDRVTPTPMSDSDLNQFFRDW